MGCCGNKPEEPKKKDEPPKPKPPEPPKKPDPPPESESEPSESDADRLLARTQWDSESFDETKDVHKTPKGLVTILRALRSGSWILRFMEAPNEKNPSKICFKSGVAKDGKEERIAEGLIMQAASKVKYWLRGEWDTHDALHFTRHQGPAEDGDTEFSGRLDRHTGIIKGKVRRMALNRETDSCESFHMETEDEFELQRFRKRPEPLKETKPPAETSVYSPPPPEPVQPPPPPPPKVKPRTVASMLHEEHLLVETPHDGSWFCSNCNYECPETNPAHEIMFSCDHCPHLVYCQDCAEMSKDKVYKSGLWSGIMQRYKTDWVQFQIYLRFLRNGEMGGYGIQLFEGKIYKYNIEGTYIDSVDGKAPVSGISPPAARFSKRTFLAKELVEEMTFDVKLSDRDCLMGQAVGTGLTKPRVCVLWRGDPEARPACWLDLVGAASCDETSDFESVISFAPETVSVPGPPPMAAPPPLPPPPRPPPELTSQTVTSPSPSQTTTSPSDTSSWSSESSARRRIERRRPSNNNHNNNRSTTPNNNSPQQPPRKSAASAQTSSAPLRSAPRPTAAQPTSRAAPLRAAAALPSSSSSPQKDQQAERSAAPSSKKPAPKSDIDKLLDRIQSNPVSSAGKYLAAARKKPSSSKPNSPATRAHVGSIFISKDFSKHHHHPDRGAVPSRSPSPSHTSETESSIYSETTGTGSRSSRSSTFTGSSRSGSSSSRSSRSRSGSSGSTRSSGSSASTVSVDSIQLSKQKRSTQPRQGGATKNASAQKVEQMSEADQSALLASLLASKGLAATSVEQSVPPASPANQAGTGPVSKGDKMVRELESVGAVLKAQRSQLLASQKLLNSASVNIPPPSRPSTSPATKSHQVSRRSRSPSRRRHHHHHHRSRSRGRRSRSSSSSGSRSGSSRSGSGSSSRSSSGSQSRSESEGSSSRSDDSRDTESDFESRPHPAPQHGRPRRTSGGKTNTAAASASLPSHSAATTTTPAAASLSSAVQKRQPNKTFALSSRGVGRNATAILSSEPAHDSADYAHHNHHHHSQPSDLLALPSSAPPPPPTTTTTAAAAAEQQQQQQQQPPTLSHSRPDGQRRPLPPRLQRAPSTSGSVSGSEVSSVYSDDASSTQSATQPVRDMLARIHNDYPSDSDSADTYTESDSRASR